MIKLNKNNLAPHIAITFLVSMSTLNAQENYVAYELVRDNNWDDLITEDIDGDGAKDLIFSHYDPMIGRELRILHQREDGSFSSEPQRIEIKTEIIALGFADLRTRHLGACQHAVGVAETGIAAIVGFVGLIG